MPEMADIYALANERTERTIRDFLAQFLPSPIEIASEYEIPQYSRTPHTVFSIASELIRYCCEKQCETHSIYWRSDSVPENGMAFFLSDGGLVLGVSTQADNFARVDFVAAELGRFLGTEEVIVMYEDLPPETIDEFHAFFQGLTASPGEDARCCRAHRPIKASGPTT